MKTILAISEVYGWVKKEEKADKLGNSGEIILDQAVYLLRCERRSHLLLLQCFPQYNRYLHPFKPWAQISPSLSRCCSGMYSQQWQKWQTRLFSGWRKAVIYYMWKRKRQRKKKKEVSSVKHQWLSSVFFHVEWNAAVFMGSSSLQAPGKTLEYPTLEKKIQFLFSHQAARRWHINPLQPFNNVGSKSELCRPTNARLCHGKFIGQPPPGIFPQPFSPPHVLLSWRLWKGPVFYKESIKNDHQTFRIFGTINMWSNNKCIVLYIFTITINTWREASDQKVALQPLVPILHREILFLGDCITTFCDL